MTEVCALQDLRVLYLHTPAKPDVTPERLRSLGLNVTYQRFTIDTPANVTDYDIVVVSVCCSHNLLSYHLGLLCPLLKGTQERHLMNAFV